MLLLRKGISGLYATSGSGTRLVRETLRTSLERGG